MEGMEASKVSNRLEEKYGVDNEGLELAEWYYKLDQNPKVQSFLKIAQAQHQSEKQKEINAAILPEAMQKEMLEKAFALGQPQIKTDGTMTFDYWLATQTLVVEY